MRGDADAGIVISIFALVLVIVLMTTGDETTNVELQNYCEMREIYRDSGGEYGWPAGAHSKFDDGDCK